MGAGLDGFFFKDTPSLKRELNLTVKYVTFNHSNMSSNLIALKYLTINRLILLYINLTLYGRLQEGLLLQLKLGILVTFLLVNKNISFTLVSKYINRLFIVI